MSAPPAAQDVWVYLSTSPLFFLTMTVLAYQGGVWLHQRAGRSPLVNPVLIAVVALCALLLTTGTPYDRYFEGAQFVHFMLGPATVALAIPLHSQLAALRRSWPAIIAAVLAGGAAAAASALAIGWALGASEPTLIALAAKSVTSPIAMGVAEQLGGLPSLTAVVVIMTGMLGATIVTPVLNALKVRDWRARGLAAGTAAHGIGAARAFQVNETAGAYAGLAMGLNGLLTALLAPLLIGIVR